MHEVEWHYVNQGASFSCFHTFFTGQKKLGTVVTPDTWKAGARNTTGLDSIKILFKK